jgi:putative phosphoribosyl transferase
MRVALRAARRRNPAWLVLAAPVAAPDTIAKLRPEADEVVCVDMPAGLGAIGFYYTDFHQVSDAEVTAILARAAQPSEREPAASDQAAKETAPEPTANTC